jgi:hypothetical protein
MWSILIGPHVSNFDWTGCLAGYEEKWDQVARVWQWWRVTFMGPLGGFWSKLSRKCVTGWNDNMHVTFCTNYAVWEWVLDNKRSLAPAGRVKTNKQTIGPGNYTYVGICNMTLKAHIPESPHVLKESMQCHFASSNFNQVAKNYLQKKCFHL